MGSIINLRTARKNKKREAKELIAEQNRLVHGQTLGEKKKQKAEQLKQKRNLDGHQLGLSEPRDE